MANWYITDYTFIGDDTELDSLYNELRKIEETSDPNRDDIHWLGFVVEAMGGQVKKVPCRGEWFDLKIKNGSLTFSTSTANASCHGIMDLICDKYDSLKYYYRSDTDYPTTNDRKAKFYKPYRIELPDEEIDESFLTKEDALKWLSEKLGHDITSEDDLESYSNIWMTEYKFLSNSERAMADAFIAMLWQGRFEKDKN